MKVSPHIVAIITARSGSKGLPNKNILDLDGKPLIAYSIETCLNSSLVARTILSTDSIEYQKIGLSLGSECPFIRPSHLAKDDSTDADVIAHCLEYLTSDRSVQTKPDFLVHVRPTTPFRTVELFDQGIKKFVLNVCEGYSSLRSVHRMSESAYKCFEIEEAQLTSVFSHSRNLDLFNNARQLFPETYEANGYVDVISVDNFRASGNLHGSKVLAYETPPVIEIDTIWDFQMANLAAKLNRGQNGK